MDYEPEWWRPIKQTDDFKSPLKDTDSEYVRAVKMGYETLTPNALSIARKHTGLSGYKNYARQLYTMKRHAKTQGKTTQEYCKEHCKIISYTGKEEGMTLDEFKCSRGKRWERAVRPSASRRPLPQRAAARRRVCHGP